jgi:hypothetical protein
MIVACWRSVTRVSEQTFSLRCDTSTVSVHADAVRRGQIENLRPIRTDLLAGAFTFRPRMPDIHTADRVVKNMTDRALESPDSFHIYNRDLDR